MMRGFARAVSTTMRRAVEPTRFLALALLLGCSGTPARPSVTFEKPADKPHAPLPLVGFVVVDPIAILHTEPFEGSERARVLLTDEDALAARSADESFALFRHVEDVADGWVHVETVPQDAVAKGYECTQPIHRLRFLRLSLYVRKSALVDVTTKRTKVEYQDGSAVTFVPGVALHPLEGTAPKAKREGVERTVRVDGFSFGATLALDAVGKIFVPGAAFKRDDTHFYIESDIVFAGRTWSESEIDRRLRNVVEKKKIIGGVSTLATVSSECAQYEFVVPTEGLRKGGYGYGYGLGTLGSSKTEWVKKDAAIYWRNGKRAGIAVESHRLPSVPKSGGARRCFPFTLLDGVEEKTIAGLQNHLVLCIDEKDIEWKW